ncbi:hypothetical protein [Archangium primigenium]|uniref:hypothetical protein n=1 Tax=[Archangium] primigenium TaxID=2792470 RepID=UPI00195BDDEF|nr:hypothetical protein [Archangium primigenium]MBM7118897.1 hypothetical protein [Archangium primigenium]
MATPLPSWDVRTAIRFLLSCLVGVALALGLVGTHLGYSQKGALVGMGGVF